MAVVELEEYKKTVDPADLLRSKKPATESAFQSAGEVKPVHIHPTDSNAAPTNISTTLDNKEEAELIQFLHENWDIFAFRFSVADRRKCSFTGLALGSTLRRCSASSLGTLGMS